MTRHKLDPDQRAEILARYVAGETLTKLAADYGCITQTIVRTIKELDPSALRGVTSNGRPGRYTAEQKIDMFNRYEAGETADQIGADYACSRQTVLRIVKDQNSSVIRPGGPSKFTAEQKQEIADRYAAGESLRALAKEYGCSVPNISTIVKNRGVDARPLGLPPMSDEIVEAIRGLRVAGNSYRQIGEALGLHYGTVGDVCRRRLGLATFGLDEDDEATSLIRFPGSLPGEKSASWRGGRVFKRGYAFIAIDADDPLFCMTYNNGYAPEHRIVMARKLGRPLRRRETVHHINGDGLENAPDNLQLRQGNHGNGVVMECAECGSHDVKFVPIADTLS